MKNLPHWNLNSIFKGIEDPAYQEACRRFAEAAAAFRNKAADSAQQQEDPALWLTECLETCRRAWELHEELGSFAYCLYSTDTGNRRYVTELDRIDEAALPFRSALNIFRERLTAIGASLAAIIEEKPQLGEFTFFLKEQLFLQQHQMELKEEELAADLARSGGEAWSRLQESLSSSITALWDEESGERKTTVELRALAFSPDRETRRKAYQKELALWKEYEIPFAAALNGVKGTAATLNRRRGYESLLSQSTKQARITPETLEALTSTMEGALPLFRRYLKAKAQVLGLEQLAFFDIFAPLPGDTRRWSYDEAREFITAQFYAFSPEMGRFGEEAFSKKWIDAEPRQGKIGGAYCTSFPLTGESRILCNFDGSFYNVSTVAHELGHAWHHHVLRDQPVIHQDYPMTLAETASIFSETFITMAALDEMEGKEKLAVLESYLQGCTQVIVDILSRYLFEKSVMAERQRGELAPRDFCRIMEEAQEASYGDGLDSRFRHPYMWAVKGHYYRPDLGFYNFPYAFGQLFGLGLYGAYTRDSQGFPRLYTELLRQTGRSTAEDLTGSLGFDIRKPDFWQSGIDTIGVLVDQFCSIVEKGDKE